MSKQPMRISDGHADQAIGQLRWGGVLFFAISLILSVLSWYYMETISGEGVPLTGTQLIGGFLVLVFIHAMLTMTIERGLAYTHVSHHWRYRIAFLSSAIVFCIHGLILVITNPQIIYLLWFVAALLGAFLGGLLATSVQDRLWEDNSPPSGHIREEVYKMHVNIIGIPKRTPLGKRIFDVSLALFGLIVSLPIWLLSTFMVWFEEPGPVLFVKNSVGKGGINFHQLKLRTMVRGAEINTGPVLASESDERILIIGGLLRKTALDELPQLINILKGEMSFVGPRPQRTVLVRGYLEDMPEYAERHLVLPGLAGLAQVAGDYFLTPRQKLRFDRLYIKYTGIGYDIKLLFLAFLITFWYRWRRDWNGRLPRSLMRFGSSSL